MRTQLLLATAVAAALGLPLNGQTTPTAAPDAAISAASTPSGASLDAIRLRALQAVLDARERRQDWHDAAQQAGDPIRVDALKSQLIQRLSGLAPRVAKELAARPQDDALVSVSVFKEAGGEGKQALLAVTFEGMGSDIGSDYFANVLAGQSKPPQAEGIPEGLVPDPAASSYLVFFLGKNGLLAGDIPQAKMRQSVVSAINHQRELAQRQDQVAQQQQQKEARDRQSLDQAQQSAAQQPAQDTQQQVISEYPYGIGGAANYDDGYYYPGVGVPIVILPNGNVNSPEWRSRERRREEALERAHGSHGAAAANSANNGQPFTPSPAGVNIPPGSQGVAIPPASAGVRQPAGSAGVREPAGEAGVRTGQGGQGRVQEQTPAPPPEQRQSPTPTRETPAREAPVREAPAREAPAQQAPAQQAPAQQAPAPQAPAARQAPASGGGAATGGAAGGAKR